ncbi:hypothetical protein RAG26_23995, partial [Klebsiella pneumoniae]
MLANPLRPPLPPAGDKVLTAQALSLIHISEPTRLQ